MNGSKSAREPVAHFTRPATSQAVEPPESTQFANSQSAKENDDAKAEIVKTGKTTILTPTAAETAELRKTMAPLYDEMGKRVGKQLIDEVVKTVSSQS